MDNRIDMSDADLRKWFNQFGLPAPDRSLQLNRAEFVTKFHRARQQRRWLEWAWIAGATALLLMCLVGLHFVTQSQRLATRQALRQGPASARHVAVATHRIAADVIPGSVFAIKDGWVAQTVQGSRLIQGATPIVPWWNSQWVPLAAVPGGILARSTTGVSTDAILGSSRGTYHTLSVPGRTPFVVANPGQSGDIAWMTAQGSVTWDGVTLTRVLQAVSSAHVHAAVFVDAQAATMTTGISETYIAGNYHKVLLRAPRYLLPVFSSSGRWLALATGPTPHPQLRVFNRQTKTIRTWAMAVSAMAWDGAHHLLVVTGHTLKMLNPGTNHWKQVPLPGPCNGVWGIGSHTWLVLTTQGRQTQLALITSAGHVHTIMPVLRRADGPVVIPGFAPGTFAVLSPTRTLWVVTVKSGG